MCVSRSLGLVLNVIGWFSSSRLEGAIVKEGWGGWGGDNDGCIERRTRKTKMDIGDRSDEEQDEEFKSN